MKLKSNKDYKDQGIKIQVKGREYPLIRTTTKMAVYDDGSGKERKVKLENTKVVETEQKTNTEQTEQTKKFWYFGGHMPFVPENCDNKNIFTDEHGIRWIDNVICAKCKKKCQRRKEFKKITTYDGLREDWENYKGE